MQSFDSTNSRHCILLARARRSIRRAADAGVLLLGESGAGKSDLALRLIALGAKLVADDRMELSVEDRSPHRARARNASTGLIEIRECGHHHPALCSPCAQSRSPCCWARRRICRACPSANSTRRHGINLARNGRPPLIRLCAFRASAPAKIAAAAAAFAHALFREDHQAQLRAFLTPQH